MANSDILGLVKQLMENEEVKNLLDGGLENIDLGKVTEIASGMGFDIAPDQLKDALQAYDKLDDSPLGGLLKGILG